MFGKNKRKLNMHYFLVQENNELVNLPNCKFEEGKRDLHEVNQIGGQPLFVQGRKQPDIFTFPVPVGALLHPCLIVDEDAIVRRVRVSLTETDAHSHMAIGFVEEEYEALNIEEAKKAISATIEKI
jgi:hypothetical protein